MTNRTRLIRSALLCAVLALPAWPAAAATEAELVVKAMAGDYQAQRNLAYGYATGGWGQKKDGPLACSWYLLVMRSGSPRLDVTDVGNVDVYCGKLDFAKRLAAERKATDLYRQIYAKK